MLRILSKPLFFHQTSVSMDNRDYFEQEYQAFQESTLYTKLTQKFTPLPYWKKYRLVKLITLVASYLFNVLSGITASSLVYFFLLKLTNEWAAFSCTLIGITLLELFKRKLSSLTFKEFLMNRKIQYLSVVLLTVLSGISILSSYYGSKELVFKFSPAAPLVKLEDATYDLDTQLTNIEEQIAEARETKWAGTTTSASQKTITSLNKQKEALLAEVIRVRKQTDEENEFAQAEHLQELTINANHFALLTLLLELLFLASAFYLQYYDFRSYIEFCRPVETVATDNVMVTTKDEADLALTESTGVATIATTTLIPPDILLGAIKNAKSNLSAYESKIKNGQGTLAANKRGIERWQRKLEELEKLLPKNGVENH